MSSTSRKQRALKGDPSSRKTRWLSCGNCSLKSNSLTSRIRKIANTGLNANLTKSQSGTFVPISVTKSVERVEALGASRHASGGSDNVDDDTLGRLETYDNLVGKDVNDAIDQPL